MTATEPTFPGGPVWHVPLAASPGAVGPLEPDPERRYGICLSGGGIRSATFALGGLQLLDELDPSSPWALSQADYLAAVSGGSYIAATYQFLAQGGQGAMDDAPTTAAPSPLIPRTDKVESHLRRFSTHLADGTKEWLLALGEVLAKAASGFGLVLLLLWVTALPTGWLARSWLHGVDELNQPAPTLDLVVGLTIAMVVAAFAALTLVNWFLTGGSVTSPASAALQQSAKTAVLLTLALAVVVPLAAPRVEDAVTGVADLVGLHDDDAKGPKRQDVLADVSDIASAASDAGAAAADAAAAAPRGRVEALDAAIASADAAANVARLAADDLQRSIVDDGAPERLTIPLVDDVATLCRPSGPTVAGPEPPGLVTLACQAANATADAARAATAVAEGTKTGDPAAAAKAATAANKAAGAAAKAAKAMGEVSSAIDGHASPATSDERPPLAWAGLSALVTAIGGFVGKRRLDVGNGPAAPAKPGGKPAIWQRLGFGSIAEVAAGVLCGVVIVVAFSDLVVDAWRRGPQGEIDLLFTARGVVWWTGAVVVLGAAFAVANVNTWSLRTFYHRRLWQAYAVTPEGETAPWATDTRLSQVGRKVEGFPELVICAAAQSSGREWAPPGRRAVSFVFTGTACGGPTTGYVKTEGLEEYLGKKYRTPLTLYGAVATSGAAFGPAMGRQSKGGLGAVLAVANARLGAWLPNPVWMKALAEIAPDAPAIGALPKRPGLLWWFREILGQYRLDASMVLTTDGGHIENLGLVELLRRRCSDILCFDASGAGATPTTLAEAVVLAREELGVRIELFSPNGEPLLDTDVAGADPLRRTAKDEPSLAERLARFPVIVGVIHYPRVVHEGGPTIEAHLGRLVYGTLALTKRSEWDVLEYAQRNATFPNDGTDQQWFRANTFEAYHQLGRDVAAAMVAAGDGFPPVPPSGVPFPPPPPPDELDWRGGVVVVTADELR